MDKLYEGKTSFPGTGSSVFQYVSQNRHRLTTALFLLSFFTMIMENPRRFMAAGGEEPFAVAGWMLVGAGIVVRLWATLYVSGHKDKQLIIQGPYELVRNPLYAANFISVTGLAILSESVVAGLIIFTGMLLIYYATIRYEENKLSRLFDQEYFDYIERVPRLLPRLDNIRHWLLNSQIHQVSNRNIRCELFRGLRTLGVACAIHLSAETIEYLQAAHVLNIL